MCRTVLPGSNRLHLNHDRLSLSKVSLNACYLSLGKKNGHMLKEIKSEGKYISKIYIFVKSC